MHGFLHVGFRYSGSLESDQNWFVPHCVFLTELPTPALVINTGTPALPNSLPRILAGQSFNMSCRNLLRTSSSYNSVLAASVEWSVLPPKAVVNTPSRPSSSISFFLAHPEPGRYCARCRSVDFAGITRSRLCFEVVIDGTSLNEESLLIIPFLCHHYLEVSFSWICY